MSIFNSMLGSMRSSFEDPRAQEHELPLYRSSSASASRIPPPLVSTIWEPSLAKLSLGPRVPDDIRALQREAQDAEAQLQELLDAQADALMGAPKAVDPSTSGLEASASTTSTVGSRAFGRKKALNANGARRGIRSLIKKVARLKEAELNALTEDLEELEIIADRTHRWVLERSSLVTRMEQVKAQRSDDRYKELQDEALQLGEQIGQKERELRVLKQRQRTVLTKLSELQNFADAEAASYRYSLEDLDKEIRGTLATLPHARYISLPEAPFRSLPPSRRTLEMAHDYWRDECDHLNRRCREVDYELVAAREGAAVWDEVLKRVTAFEESIREATIKADTEDAGPSELLMKLENTMAFLEKKLDIVTEKGWNLLICAITAEYEALQKGKVILEQTLGVSREGREMGATHDDADRHQTETEEDPASPVFRNIHSSPLSSSPPEPRTSGPGQEHPARYADAADSDPDPELLISHEDTDTD